MKKRADPGTHGFSRCSIDEVIVSHGFIAGVAWPTNMKIIPTGLAAVSAPARAQPYGRLGATVSKRAGHSAAYRPWRTLVRECRPEQAPSFGDPRRQRPQHAAVAFRVDNDSVFVFADLERHIRTKPTPAPRKRRRSRVGYLLTAGPATVARGPPVDRRDARATCTDEANAE